jgi:peroxiredoxin
VKRIRFSWSWAILVAFVCTVPGIVSAQAPAAGAAAPDFALKSADGGSVRLKEHRGEVVLLNFWASWCGPCRDEMPLLNRLYQRFRHAGFVVLGVNVDEEPGKAAQMAKRLGVTYPVLFDNEKQVSRLYDLRAMPSTVIVDRDGKVRYVHKGYTSAYDELYQKEIRELLAR